MHHLDKKGWFMCEYMNKRTITTTTYVCWDCWRARRWYDGIVYVVHAT